MKNIQEVYPDFEYCESDYTPMLDSFGYEKLLQVDDDDYQGDSRILYRNGEQYGLLIFGWGSCSGCDALQDCNSLEEIDTLRLSLHESIVWRTAQEMRDYLEQHDWQGDYAYSPEFVEKAKELLHE